MIKPKLKDILTNLDRQLNISGHIDIGVDCEINAVANAVYDILEYLIDKEEQNDLEKENLRDREDNR